jgi:hypothetical protein
LAEARAVAGHGCAAGARSGEPALVVAPRRLGAAVATAATVRDAPVTLTLHRGPAAGLAWRALCR